MSIPWSVINARLVEAGTITAGIGRRAQARGCNRCHARIITGYDAEVCALLAQVDPAPLSALGEAIAQLEGRRTYALIPDSGRLVLDDRTAGRIRHRPAGSGSFDVVPEHACGRATPESLQVPSVLLTRHAAHPAADAAPPY